MSSDQYSLKWDFYKNNVCYGLSSLQQSQEFVDMTLAADGHFVKVHQMILSLSSPYLRDLIKSASCSHPVIFLNKVSHITLSYILEFIYTGEVLVSKENIDDLIIAGKDLHIKGLDSLTTSSIQECDGEEALQLEHIELPQTSLRVIEDGFLVDSLKENETENASGVHESQDVLFIDEDASLKNSNKSKKNATNVVAESMPSDTTVQYTLSNQGNIQMVLNRYIYCLRYNYKHAKPAVRFWRCVNYTKKKCLATVTTKDDIVVRRTCAHNHEFHDKRILKKLQEGAIFTAVKDAEILGNRLKRGSKY